MNVQRLGRARATGSEAGERFVPVIATIREWDERHLAARPTSREAGPG